MNGFNQIKERKIISKLETISVKSEHYNKTLLFNEIKTCAKSTPLFAIVSNSRPGQPWEPATAWMNAYKFNDQNTTLIIWFV